MSDSRKPNNLKHSSSPYLKQHAYNPVNWYPWGDEALGIASKEDKPIIISIGYSACHWCHVMERESFENDEVARVMNEHFVCIKIDREERPDVDQIYMEAIQTMGLPGGWPLNVFAMPDQKPFYGGTYFQPKQWLHILNNVALAFKEKRKQLEESAREFAKAITLTDTEKYGLEDQGLSPSADELQKMVLAMQNHFDSKEGGLRRAPKFPNPSIWKFLLASNLIVQEKAIADQFDLTLTKMSNGGIYDHLGGGFARYSVDERWFAPHFEKMLYDNGQLISLYSNAYQVSKNRRYREVIEDSIQFVRRELMSPDNGFYSALDADSEGEEGNYYIWKEKELDYLLGSDAELFKSFYQTKPEGNWERGLNILHTSGTIEDFSETNDHRSSETTSIVNRAKSILLKHREKREKPGLDDKILTSWNALMSKALIDAYHAVGNEEFLELAEKNASFIFKHLYANGALLRSKPSGEQSVSGYLDDYAFVIDFMLSLYQTNFEDRWLDLATMLSEYTIDNFYDSNEELFYYTDVNSEQLIARKKEIFDNVIPASNSAMAQNLYYLGILLENNRYLELSRSMLSKVVPLMKNEVQYLTNWGTLYSLYTFPILEIAIVGSQYLEYAHEIQRHFIPNKVIAAAPHPGDQPLLQNRTAIGDKTTIYVCFNKSCRLPVHSVDEALKQIKNYLPYRQ